MRFQGKQPNFYQLNNNKLRELYDTQCSPCIGSYPECAKPDSHGIEGDPEKAKRFRCPKFCNGLTFVEIPIDRKKAIKETEDSYYYEFPKDRFYIIRWLDSGGVHLYPTANGKLPEGYNTKEDAENYIKSWFTPDTAKVVNGLEASKYPVPKRW